MNLGALLTELVAVVAAQTGRPTGDGVAPADGVPDTSDFPYLVVTQVSDTDTVEIMAAAAGVNKVTYQIAAIGLTRAQADAARDRARAVLDPTVAVASADAKWSGARWIDMSTVDPTDSGDRWQSVLRIGAVVVAV